MARFNHPVVALTNGIRVANFSSPHSFKFTDGSVLPACDAETVKMSELETQEIPFLHHALPITDVRLIFKMTSVVLEELIALDDDGEIDIVLVPLPVMESLKALRMFDRSMKCRVVRVADRATKTIHIDRFCI